MCVCVGGGRGGGGTKSSHPLKKGEGGANIFGPVIFSFCKGQAKYI